MLKTQVQIPRKWYSKAEHLPKSGAQLLLFFKIRKILLFFEWKKMRFQLSALQFGKELLQVESQTEQIEFGRDVRLSPHEEASELAVAFQNTESPFYLNRTIHPKQCSTLRC